MTQDRDNFTVSIAVPGRKREDFRIDLVDGKLSINVRTGPGSSLKRSFSLPSGVRQEAIQATYDSGILWILLPKRMRAKKAVGPKSSL